MKKPIVILFLLAAVAGLFAATINFDNTSDLTTYFNGSPGHVFTNAASGGLGDSGCVAITTNTFEVWTGNTGMALPSVGQTLTASVYFYNAQNSGYNGIGYSTASTNTVTAQYLGGRPNTAGANWLGMALHGGGDFIWNDNIRAGNYSEGFDIPLGAWYRIYFMLTYLGSNNFSGTLEIWASDANGNVTSSSALKAHTVDSMTNEGMATAGIMYPYFINDGSRCTKMDDLSFHYGAGNETFEVLVTSAPSGANISTLTKAPLFTTPRTYSLEEGASVTYTVSMTDYTWIVDPLYDSNVITNIGGNKHVNFIGTYSHVGTGGFEYTGDPGVGLTGVETTLGALIVALPENIGLYATPIVMQFTGISTSNLTVQVPEGTWYVIAYYNGVWNHATPYPCVGPATVVFTGVPFGAKADVPVIITPGDATLPVTLSSFNAVLTAEQYVSLAWVTESETGVSGYNIYRSQENSLDTTILISPLLEATNSSQQQVYSYLDTELDSEGVYYYWLQGLDIDGSSSYWGPVVVNVTAVSEDNETPVIPLKTELFNAFPNPFNPVTTISYALKEAGNVKIEIFNTRGQKITGFERSYSTPGTYNVVWDGKDTTGKSVVSGIYMYKLTCGSYTATKKMIMQK
jgi:hypothetical protein